MVRESQQGSLTVVQGHRGSYEVTGVIKVMECHHRSTRVIQVTENQRGSLVVTGKVSRGHLSSITWGHKLSMTGAAHGVSALEVIETKEPSYHPNSPTRHPCAASQKVRCLFLTRASVPPSSRCGSAWRSAGCRP